MHYHCEVWFPEPPADVEAAVDLAMAPHVEDFDAEPPRGIWDWWQISGRWKGRHVPGYEPDKDPEHVKVCWLCKGTGKRTDMAVAKGCNGCSGTGRAVAWPTEWRAHAADVIAVAELPDDFTCCTLIANGRAYTDHLFKPYPEAEAGFDGLLKPKLAALGLVGGYVVTVDYHS